MFPLMCWPNKLGYILQDAIHVILKYMLYWSTCYIEVYWPLYFPDHPNVKSRRLNHSVPGPGLLIKRMCKYTKQGVFHFLPVNFSADLYCKIKPSWSNESSFCYLLQTRWKVFTNGNFLLNQLSYCSSLLRQLVTTFLTHIRHTRNSFADQMQKYRVSQKK